MSWSQRSELAPANFLSMFKRVKFARSTVPCDIAWYGSLKWAEMSNFSLSLQNSSLLKFDALSLLIIFGTENNEKKTTPKVVQRFPPLSWIEEV